MRRLRTFGRPIKSSCSGRSNYFHPAPLHAGALALAHFFERLGREYELCQNACDGVHCGGPWPGILHTHCHPSMDTES